MKNQQTVFNDLFGHITEFLSESDISFEERVAVYEILIESFLDFGTKELDEHLNLDPAFDSVWQEKYPELKEEDEE